MFDGIPEYKKTQNPALFFNSSLTYRASLDIMPTRSELLQLRDIRRPTPYYGGELETRLKPELPSALVVLKYCFLKSK